MADATIEVFVFPLKERICCADHSSSCHCPVLTSHPDKMFAGNRLQSPQHIHQSGWIGVSVLKFKNQMTAITHSWWGQFQSSARTVLIVIMGWIQFTQIAKEASCHDSSPYLIQGLVYWVTCHSGWMVISSFPPHYGQDASLQTQKAELPQTIPTIICWETQDLFFFCFNSSSELSRTRVKRISLDIPPFLILNGCVCSCAHTRTRGSLLVLKSRPTKRRVTRQTLPRSLKKDTAGGKGAANLWIFTGQKVEHNVSTDSGSRRLPCQATDHWERVRGEQEGQSKAKNGTALVYSQKAVMVYNARAKSTLTSTKSRTNM